MFNKRNNLPPAVKYLSLIVHEYWSKQYIYNEFGRYRVKSFFSVDTVVASNHHTPSTRAAVTEDCRVYCVQSIYMYSAIVYITMQIIITWQLVLNRYTSITVCRDIRCIVCRGQGHDILILFVFKRVIQCPHIDDTGDTDVLLPHFVENGSGPAVDTWRENDEH